MSVRVRYRRTELSEGVVEVIREAEKFEVMDDNTVKLWGRREDDGKLYVCGYIHPDRWESAVQVEDADAQ